MKRDEEFMKLALARAREGVDRGESPFGACIVQDGEVIACEHNIVISSVDSTAHAEIHAIRKACKKLSTIDLSGCTIYSTCEPCPMCFSAIHWAKISKIIFGAKIEDSQHFGFSELAISNEQLKREGNCNIEITGNFMSDECIKMFDYWSKKGDKIVY